jgi:uncharacterized alkaline shock family protein YloU
LKIIKGDLIVKTKAEKAELEQGHVKMADEVVSVIAALAATEVKGVKSMSGGIVDGIADVLGRKNLTKGVKVEVGEKEAAIDLNIIVEYGVKIQEVAVAIQESVLKSVESMTGLKVVEVNVNVQGVSFKDEPVAEEAHRVK